MSRICGIELKASEAILVVLECNDDNIEFIDLEPRRIKLGNDESSELVKSFHESVINFIRDNHIEKVIIKKRAKKGSMAGGAISFKIEALIQLNGIAEVSFVSGQGIASENKKNPFTIPVNMKKYQESAFMSASLYKRKN